MRVYLGLGSNVGDRIANLQAAVNFIDLRLGDVRKISPVYETAPLYIEEQEPFYNAALELVTDIEPLELLVRVKELEKEIGRIPRERYGPREIDIDLLAAFADDGSVVSVQSERLTLPHAKLGERRFVLEPLQAVCGDFGGLPLPMDQAVSALANVHLSIIKD